MQALRAAGRTGRGSWRAVAAAVLLAAPLLCSCSHQPARQTATPPAAAEHAAADPHTRAALLRIAQTFNNAYDNGYFGAVYDRWDPRSQALISRAEYIRRHRLCAPATHATAVVTGARRGPAGTWLVSYRISGSTLTDTWYYVRHRWLFDIVASNPDAARLYHLPFARYVAAVGCSTH